MKLFKHQQYSVKFLTKQDRVLDLSDPGTGKTGVHITDFANRRKKNGACALVLAPKSLLKSAWQNDFKKFAPTMRTSIATAQNREVAFNADADVYITNIDAATWLLKQKPAFFKKFGHLILDESTAFKHHTSARSRALAKIRKHFPVRRALTGTPTSNGITDIWHQALLIDDGRRLGTSFFAFRSAVCTPVQNGPSVQHVKWIDRPNAEAAVGALLHDIVIRHRFEDCVDIPPNYQYAMPFDLSAKHLAQYKELEATSILQLKKSTVMAINGAVLYGKLLQVASGASYAENDLDGEGSYTLINSDRYELVLDLVEARQHCLVSFLWKHQRDELVKGAEARGMTYAIIDGNTKNVDEIVTNYQNGLYKVIFAHPKSAAHGLTLTRGTTTIFASPTNNLEWYLQFLKRIYRISQTEKTETIVVVAQGTIDEAVWAATQTKDLKQTQLLRFLEIA